MHNIMLSPPIVDAYLLYSYDMKFKVPQTWSKPKTPISNIRYIETTTCFLLLSYKISRSQNKTKPTLYSPPKIPNPQNQKTTMYPQFILFLVFLCFSFYLFLTLFPKRCPSPKNPKKIIVYFPPKSSNHTISKTKIPNDVEIPESQNLPEGSVSACFPVLF